MSENLSRDHLPKLRVAIKIYGNDLDKLEKYAKQVELIAQNNPGAINVDNPLSTNSTDLFFNINRDKAMMMGVPDFCNRQDNSEVTSTEIPLENLEIGMLKNTTSFCVMILKINSKWKTLIRSK